MLHPQSLPTNPTINIYIDILGGGHQVDPNRFKKAGKEEEEEEEDNYLSSYSIMESTLMGCSSSSSLKFCGFRPVLVGQVERRPLLTRAGRRDQDCTGGRMVDDNMIVLRKRIHEMKMIERNYEPPAEWMEWEKRCYTSYDSIICDFLAVVQSQLMNTRPSLALGIAAFIAFSVPVSTTVLFSNLMQMALRLVELGGIHFSSYPN